jgi:hypothetical protein
MVISSRPTLDEPARTVRLARPRRRDQRVERRHHRHRRDLSALDEQERRRIQAGAPLAVELQHQHLRDTPVGRGQRQPHPDDQADGQQLARVAADAVEGDLRDAQDRCGRQRGGHERGRQQGGSKRDEPTVQRRDRDDRHAPDDAVECQDRNRAVVAHTDLEGGTQGLRRGGQDGRADQRPCEHLALDQQHAGRERAERRHHGQPGADDQKRAEHVRLVLGVRGDPPHGDLLDAEVCDRAGDRRHRQQRRPGAAARYAERARDEDDDDEAEAQVKQPAGEPDQDVAGRMGAGDARHGCPQTMVVGTDGSDTAG